MPDQIIKETLREVEPLGADERIGAAARRVLDAGLPALPVVEPDGSFAGIFGEREFMIALFPGYVGELASSAMIRRSIDETIERRVGCVFEPVRAYLTTDHVVVEDDYSDTQLAELFLHHRVLVIPIATAGRIHAVVIRNDFFRVLVAKLEASAETNRPDISEGNE
jgi:CBS domain-containing protein